MQKSLVSHLITKYRFSYKALFFSYLVCIIRTRFEIRFRVFLLLRRNILFHISSILHRSIRCVWSDHVVPDLCAILSAKCLARYNLMLCMHFACDCQRCLCLNFLPQTGHLKVGSLPHSSRMWFLKEPCHR